MGHLLLSKSVVYETMILPALAGRLRGPYVDIRGDIQVWIPSGRDWTVCPARRRLSFIARVDPSIHLPCPQPAPYQVLGLYVSVLGRGGGIHIWID